MKYSQSQKAVMLDSFSSVIKKFAGFRVPKLCLKFDGTTFHQNIYCMIIFESYGQDIYQQRDIGVALGAV